MKKLFDKIKIGSLALENRLVRSATWENLADKGGYVSDRLIAMYEELAAGRVGLIITGYSSVVREDAPDSGMLAIYDDSFIPGYTRLTEAVHRNGGRIFLQIVYRGSQSGAGPLLAMSSVKHKESGTTPKEMTVDEILEMEEYFAEAALRAKKAGFDGVQIHAAHGYFISQTLSPYYNRREDGYGGNTIKRTRFLTETYDRIRRKVEDDFPIAMKINCSDFEEGGAGFAECLAACTALDKKGIDAIEISGGGRLWATHNKEESIYGQYASEIADNVKAKVILVGNNRDPERMEKLLNKTNISLLSMSRPFFHEPGIVARWEKGDLAPSGCLACGRCYSPGGNSCILRRKG